MFRIQTLLNSIWLFNGIEEKNLKKVILAMDIKTFEKGEVIIEQGKFGKELYIIEKGSARCLKDGIEIKIYQPGEVFGELALLYNCNR